MAYFISKCGGLRMNSSDFTEIDDVITSATEVTDVFTPTYSDGVSATFNATQYESKAGKQSLTFTASIVDVYTPTYSSGLTANFDDTKYAIAYEKKSTTFTASIIDSVTTWSDGVSTLSKEDMGDIGFTNIIGVVDGSTITITYTQNIIWSDDGGTQVNISDFGFTAITGAVDGSTIAVAYTQGSEPREELVGEEFVASMCGGQKFDDGVFDEVKVNGKDVITTIGTSSANEYIRANCSLLFDADKFEIGDDGEIVLS